MSITGIKRNRPRRDRQGEIYGRIEVGEFSHSDKYHIAWWHVKCQDCGYEQVINTGRFTSMKCKPCWMAQRQRDRQAGIVRPYILKGLRAGGRPRRLLEPTMDLEALTILNHFGPKAIAS